MEIINNAAQSATSLVNINNTNNMDNTYPIVEEVKTVAPSTGVEPTSVAISSIINRAQTCGILVRNIPSIDYRHLVLAGYKFAYLYGNRDIDPVHVEKLWKDVKDTADKRFSKHGVVIPLSVALKAAMVMPEEDRPKFYDENGNEITPETPGVESYLLIIDGQHREMTCKIHPEANMDVDIVESQGDVITFVQNYNKLQKNWDTAAWRNARMTSGKSKCQLYSKSEAVQKQLGCSPKYADYLLSFTKDVCRVSDIKAGKDPNVSDEAIKRGEDLAKAIEMRFHSKDENVNFKSARKVEFVDCITHVYHNISPELVPMFTRDMRCFIANMPEDVADCIMSTIKTKDFGLAQETMLMEFKNFMATNDLEELDIQTDINYEDFLNDKDIDEEQSKPVIKPGTAAELKEQYSKLDAYKARIEAERKAEADRKKEERRLDNERKKAEKKAERERLKAEKKAAKEAVKEQTTV